MISGRRLATKDWSVIRIELKVFWENDLGIHMNIKKKRTHLLLRSNDVVALSRKSMTWGLDATCNGVWCSLSSENKFALNPTKKETHGKWPRAAAKCRAVCPKW